MGRVRKEKNRTFRARLVVWKHVLVHVRGERCEE